MGQTKDLTGMKFGRLTVVKPSEDHYTKGGQKKRTWLCKCDCGKEKTIYEEKLKSGHTQSCGCMRYENRGRLEDLTGQRFGRLTVVRFLNPSERTARQYNWWCKCDCGNEIKANATKLKTGLQQSCGCLKEENKYLIGEVNRKYKYSNKRLYGIYAAMIARCYDEKNRRYHNYGGRGITVCEEWKSNYDVFAEWAFNNGFDKDAKQGVCTLDRIDVNKGYSPDNCRWISNKEQQFNKRTNKRLTYNGETLTLTEWAEKLNVPKGTFIQGINHGKNIEYYITTYRPQHLRRKPK